MSDPQNDVKVEKVVDAGSPATIVIAGGGIVGLTLAMSIKVNLGVVPEIYEKTRTFATEAGAGLGMYPNGLRVLRDISPELLQAVRNAGYPYRHRHWQRHTGESISVSDESILSDGESELDSIGIRRSKLQKVLLKFAVELGIPIHFSKPLESVIEHDGGDDGKGGRRRLLEVKFGDGSSRMTQVLFGADGALGKARSIVAGKDNPSLGYTGVTCLMGLAKIPCHGIHFPSSDKKEFHAVFFPTAKNEQCFQFHIPVPEEEANKLNWGNLSDEVGREECHRMAMKLRSEGWHEKFIKPLDQCIHAVRVGFALLEPKLKVWYRGKIALVGDAAHPPVPYVGQGAQQGLEDAGVAVGLLESYCIDEKTGEFDASRFEEAMQVYQEIRSERSAQILDISKSLGIMQSTRSGQSRRSQTADQILKGEIILNGTLPEMVPGADHDYNEDVQRVVTEEKSAPAEIDEDEARRAFELIMNGGWTDQEDKKVAVVVQ